MGANVHHTDVVVAFVFPRAVRPLQETIFPLHDEGDGDDAGGLRHPKEQSHNGSSIIRAQLTTPRCVSLHYPSDVYLTIHARRRDSLMFVLEIHQCGIPEQITTVDTI